MYSAHRNILAVALFFASSFSGTAAFPQAVKFIRHAADPVPLGNAPLGLAPCIKDSGKAAVTTAYAITAAISEADSPCNTPSAIVPPPIAPSINPCNPAGPAQSGCNPRTDPVPDYLESLGKTGQKVLHARERVLGILQTENTCSAWFREKDPNPADTFRTLNYAVDRQGVAVVNVSRDSGPDYIYRDPYVASVGQDTGAFATITLNAGGAFFHALTTSQIVSKDGGLVTFAGPRSINIGPYSGNSGAAQTLTLLHEFGHVLNLLPVDFDNEGGKSVQNTTEVLRFCRSEIEFKSKGKWATLSVAR
jgi:hypothetical protein